MVAYCDVILDTTTESVRSGESAVANLFSDILRRHGEVDIALLHGGFFRSNSVHPTGLLSLAALQDMMPFDDFAVTLELTGAQIQAALENGVSRVSAYDGRFLHPSGLTYFFNPDDKVGHRVSNIQVSRTTEGDELPSFEPILYDSVYTCIVPSFIADGGDGFNFLKSVSRRVPPGSCRKVKHIILEHLQQRIKPVGSSAELTMSDFESIDNKLEERIVRVHSSHTFDEASIGDDGSVQTSTAICQEEECEQSMAGEASADPDINDAEKALPEQSGSPGGDQ